MGGTGAAIETHALVALAIRYCSSLLHARVYSDPLALLLLLACVARLPLLQWRLGPSNVCQQLLAAEEHRVPKAVDVALEYLAMHFDEVCIRYNGIRAISGFVAVRFRANSTIS